MNNDSLFVFKIEKIKNNKLLRSFEQQVVAESKEMAYFRLGQIYNNYNDGDCENSSIELKIKLIKMLQPDT